ncbi:BsuPI-related putative proteinase inhibitor [Ruminiclostridium cellulolyticum]|uniref:S-layer domain protein n=1 Tax=Ruminiclostridium cellulolyticum (strain ATCC 35319 / DSM 5812 / JCM 6584 / H10) TaxID=394503 RepID=B8I3V0_RUMCH|nr:BsuPI-related putative proteinase inhibitor [Ruminiclostridium cellulolyticum]ACL74427.1 S-layer domain protein [Ruminiclostridium cellulolyticum H10]
MKRTVSALILMGALALSSTFAFAQPTDNIENKFNDISGHWCNSAVQMLIGKNVLPFTGDEFSPAKAITKGEFVSLLHDALGIRIEYFAAPQIKDYFEDVDQNASYTTDLIDLVTANIIEKGGNFNPGASFSREEMIHYVMNAYKYQMGDKYALINIKPPFFNDDKDVSPEFGGDVGRAAHYKLISGSKGMFHPKANTTRGEAAVVISKLVSLLEKQNPVVTVSSEADIKDDSIVMKVTITNNSKGAVSLIHSSGQKYDFVLLDSDKKELYRWSSDKMFTMALMYSKIEAGKSVVYTETLSGEQYNTIKDKIVSMKAYVLGNSDEFTFDTKGYEIILK